MRMVGYSRGGKRFEVDEREEGKDEAKLVKRRKQIKYKKIGTYDFKISWSNGLKSTFVFTFTLNMTF